MAKIPFCMVLCKNLKDWSSNVCSWSIVENTLNLKVLKSSRKIWKSIFRSKMRVWHIYSPKTTYMHSSHIFIHQSINIYAFNIYTFTSNNIYAFNTYFFQRQHMHNHHLSNLGQWDKTKSKWFNCLY